jgi:hypothetical protein
LSRVARRILVGVAALLVLVGCRLDTTVELTIGADGAGELVVTSVADADVVDQAPGLAESLQFTDAVAAGWQVEGPAPTEDGGLTVTLRHPVTSAEDATNLLASLGPPFTDMTLQRTVDDDRETTTSDLTGQLVLPAGFDSFADSDLLAAVGGTPFADELTASAATPDSSMSVTFRAELPGEVEQTNGEETDGGLEWQAPLDGTTDDVAATTVQRPGGGGWATALAAIALVLLVAWVAVATAFIVSVARARARRRHRHRQRRLPGGSVS